MYFRLLDFVLFTFLLKKIRCILHLCLLFLEYPILPKKQKSVKHTQSFPNPCTPRIFFQRLNGGIIAVSKVQLIANVRVPGILLVRRDFLDGTSINPLKNKPRSI